MSLPVKRLYRIGILGIGTFLVIGFILFLYQHHLLANRPSENEIVPAISPNSQVEFESGALSRALREKQTRELHPGIDHAIDALVGEERR